MITDLKDRIKEDGTMIPMEEDETFDIIIAIPKDKGNILGGRYVAFTVNKANAKLMIKSTKVAGMYLRKALITLIDRKEGEIVNIKQ